MSDAADLVRNTARNHTLSPLAQALVALRFFASGSFLEVIGDTFGLPKSTKAFFAKNGFPGVIGSIDCTHIRIQTLRMNENDFVNRKGYHSLNIQAICDHEGESDSGVLGSKHRVWYPYSSFA